MSAAEKRPPDEEPAPVFGRWSAWYALIAAELLVVILVCGWLAAKNG